MKLFYTFFDIVMKFPSWHLEIRQKIFDIISYQIEAEWDNAHQKPKKKLNGIKTSTGENLKTLKS